MRKQRFIAMGAAIICALTVTAISATAAFGPANQSCYARESSAVVYAERTQWYYRVNNGVYEKRLWSITYRCWLTDWTPVNA